MAEVPTGHPGNQKIQPGIVFGPQADRNTIELVGDPCEAARPPQEVQQPFVVLDDGGIFTRVFLARVVTRAGQVTLAAVRLQKDVPAVPTARGIGRSYTNLDATAAFEREADCLRQIAQDHTGIIPIPDSTIADQLPITSLPITYCKKTRAFFHPVCPGCGGLLRDCREEKLLNQYGLSSYTRSARRFLYCAACTASGAGGTFYTAFSGVRVFAQAQVRLKVGAELYRDFGRLVARHMKPQPAEDNPPAGLRQFACLSCPHRAACYPSRQDDTQPIPAEKLLHSVAYHEFSAIVREMFHLRYDEFAQLLGGRPAEEIQHALSRRIPFPLLEQGLTGLVNGETGTPPYFFSHGDGTPSVREVLWLKLGAFEQLCEGVWRVYRYCERPHLDLQPRSVLASVDQPIPGAPARWCFRVGLVNPAAAIPVRMEDESASPVRGHFLNPPYAHHLYSSPVVRRFPFGHEEYANVTVRDVREGTAGWEVDADLISEVMSVFRLSPGDTLRITLNLPGGRLDGFAFWAEITGVVSGGYRIAGRVEAPLPAVAEALKQAIGQTVWDCRAAICRKFHLTCDLYSLGMIWLSSLLVNDDHDEARVCAAIEDVSRKLTTFAAGNSCSGPRDVERELARLLNEAGATFASEAVLYSRAHREAHGAEAPDALRLACLRHGFSMITEIGGFSVCGGGETVRPADAAERIRGVLEQLKHLNLWAEGQLFAAGALCRELGLAAGT